MTIQYLKKGIDEQQRSEDDEKVKSNKHGSTNLRNSSSCLSKLRSPSASP